MSEGAITAQQVAQAREELARAQSIMIVCHIRPDGDAIGSMLALGLALMAAGKTVQMISQDGVPGPHRRLSGSKLIRQRPEGPFDLTIAVDSSDFKRLGKSVQEILTPDWVIDHHITNLQYGRLNLVDPKAAATSEILTQLLEALDLSITPTIASALLTGVVTDTIGFQTSNMTPKTLRTAASLMEKGADLVEIYRTALIQRPFAAVRYWAYGLAKLEMDDRLVWATLTTRDRQAAGYSGNDDADLVQILSSIEEADIAVLFTEQTGGNVKVSWRARPGIDVSQIALQFGGGGHPAASGAELPGSMEEVRALILPASKMLLESIRNEKEL